MQQTATRLVIGVLGPRGRSYMSRKNRASNVPFSVVLRQSAAWIIFALLVSAGTLRAQSDTQPPRLLALSLNPGNVDVTNSSQIVTLQLHLQDDLSGIDSMSANRVGVTLTSASGTQVDRRAHV